MISFSGKDNDPDLLRSIVSTPISGLQQVSSLLGSPEFEGIFGHAEVAYVVEIDHHHSPSS